MIEPLTSALLASTAAMSNATGPAAAAPIMTDVARFQTALGATETAAWTGLGIPAGASAAAASAPTVANPELAVAMQPGAEQHTANPAPVRTLGEAILDGLKSSSNDLSRTWQAAGDVLAKPDPSVTDMLRLQMMLVQSTVQYELLGKTISKAAQNLDNVLRIQ